MRYAKHERKKKAKDPMWPKQYANMTATSLTEQTSKCEDNESTNEVIAHCEEECNEQDIIHGNELLN